MTKNKALKLRDEQTERVIKELTRQRAAFNEEIQRRFEARIERLAKNFLEIRRSI